MIKKFFTILILLFLFSCGDEEKALSSLPSNSNENIFCLGLTELDLTDDTVTFQIEGNEIELTKEMDGDNFILSGTLSMGEEAVELTITSNLNSQGSEGNATLLVGAPINISINSYLKKASCETEIVDAAGNGASQIITTNPLEETDIANISKFRSAAGHDSSDSFETCRSMKHYFQPSSKTNLTNEVYAPFDGIVVSMNTEEGGGFVDDGITNQRIAFKPSLASAYQVMFYHIDVIAELNLAPGDTINAGTLIGYGRLVRVNSDVTDPEAEPSTSNDFDIKVDVLTKDGVRAVSLFNLMTDSVFAEFSSFTTSKSDLIISKDVRDADLLTCEGETFTSSGSLLNWLISN